MSDPSTQQIFNIGGYVEPVITPPVFSVSGSLAVSGDSSTLALAWEPYPGAQFYRVYMGLGLRPLQLVGDRILGTSFSQAGLASAQNYMFEATAVIDSSSSVSSGTFNTSDIPNPPSNVYTQSCDGEIDLSWTAVPGATYSVYVATTPGGETSPYATGIEGLSEIVSGLTNGTTYYFTVRATVGSFTSGNSSEVSAQPMLNAPPTNLSAVPDVVHSQIDLTWTASATAANGYNIYQGTTSGGEITRIASEVSGTSYIASGPFIPNQVYYFVAKSINACEQESAASGEASAMLSAYALSSLSNDPMLYLRMDQTTGTMLNLGSLGAAGNLIENGSIGFTFGVAGLIANDPNLAMRFSQSNPESGVMVGTIPAVTSITSNFTWELLFNPDATQYTGTNELISIGNSSGGYSITIGSAESNEFQFSGLAGSVPRCFSDMSAYLPGVRNHLMVSYDGTNVTIIANGVVRSTTTTPGALVAPTGGNQVVILGGYLFIPGSPNTYQAQYSGVEDEVFFAPTVVPLSYAQQRYAIAIGGGNGFGNGPYEGGGAYTFSNSNLTATLNSGSFLGLQASAKSFIPHSSGKVYAELVPSGTGPFYVGAGNRTSNGALGTSSASMGYNSAGSLRVQGAAGVSVPTYAAGTVIGIEVDFGALTIQWYANNVAVGAAQSFTADTFYPGGTCTAPGDSLTAHFTQSSFAYWPRTKPGYQPWISGS
jgi:hypothetical protein